MTSEKPVLITGAAGYIGSHVALACLEAGYPVSALDNLSTGHREAVPSAAVFFEGDAGDAETVGRIVAERGISAVVHMAASTSVPASVQDPLAYYRNNSGVSASLLRACVAGGVTRFVFSSTAAVYGIPETLPVAEDAPTVPINPYGSSKLVTEWALRDAAAAHDFRYVALRYFNVAGADPEGRTGLYGGHSEHLLKVACEAAFGLRDGVTVLGTDYDTRDGTCIRDYIHVSDVAAAHLAALRYLEDGGTSQTLNCGYGRGFSVREVLEAVKAEAGRLVIRSGARRAGDPPTLIADSARIREVLQWSPQYDDLGFIVKSALTWEEISALRRETADLRRETADLRQEAANLRREEAEIRRALAAEHRSTAEIRRALIALDREHPEILPALVAENPEDTDLRRVVESVKGRGARRSRRRRRP